MNQNLRAWRGRAVLGLLGLVAALPLVQAQSIAPRVGYVYPAGGRLGTEFEVVLGGQNLDGVTNVYLSGTGVRAVVAEHVKPMTQQQFNALREKLKELQDRKAAAMRNSFRRGRTAGGASAPQASWTAEDEKQLTELRKKAARYQGRPANPGIAETVTLRVTLATNAEAGPRELRLGTPLGVSNPLVFCVGQLPEVCEKETIGAPARPFASPGAPSTPPPLEMNVTLPATLNGRIMPGDVDRYRFPARRGQHLVVMASARELIPYLADAVPGWFQATLALYDAKGKELAYTDDYRFNPDPTLHCEIPSDGEYVVEIKDAIYRGREDFVYRIALGELPFITSLFPLGGRVGVPTSVELQGWNLPFTRLTPDTTARDPGVYPLSVTQGEQHSNFMPFAIDTLPEGRDTEPNSQPGEAQRITFPVILNGRIDSPGDRDIFRFEGRAGIQIVAEVVARRLNSPLDSVLKLTDAAGQAIAFNDDCEDKGAGLTTHHADSRFSATLPANGTYYLHLADGQGHGGAEYAYRLRLSPPRRDFELRVTPSSVSLRSGAVVPLTVYALRKDGFTNEIVLALQGAPPGFALSGARIPANQDQVRITVTVPPSSPREPYRLVLEGRATVQGREVVRQAVPAEDMMQAFAYRHLVPAKDLLLAVTGAARARSGLEIVGDEPLKIPVGGTAEVRVRAPRVGPLNSQIRFEPSEPPEGITLRKVSPAAGTLAIEFGADAEKARPGMTGNLILQAFLDPVRGTTNTNALRNQRRTLIGTLPAIPFEVVRRP